ncbi:hypothetical protein GCM10022221_22620 [Actinocorallia aurea]
MDVDGRRRAALATAQERFPAVAAKVRAEWGLRIPRHLAVFCALWAGADEAERRAWRYLETGPMGLTEYFADGGLELVGRDGLDPRLHGRYRRDPAEFVTVLAGGSDGLHHGLWYDDPAELPSFVVHNYARDSAETWRTRGRTLLDVIREGIERVAADYGGDGEEAEILAPLSAALDWFAEAEHEALEADGPPRWASVRRSWDGVAPSPALPPGSGDPLAEETGARLKALHSGAPEAAAWIARAARELADGRPALALTVGAELHWLDGDAYRETSRELLAGAYRSLGRDALAEIAEVHSAHRDLPSVDVLVAPGR